MLKDYLHQVMAGGHLSTQQMETAMAAMIDGTASPVQVAALLVALRCKGETVEEITGAAQAMRARMIPVSVTRRPLLDTCGTGGDGANTFNISTCVAFVCAAAGVAVAKHGNRAVSSRSGSADVLQALGVNINVSPQIVQECIETLGIGFLFAPTLHPAMSYAAPIRQELGVRTLFNVLGPLTNPAGATCQVLGVYSPTLLQPLAQVLGNLGSQRAWVVSGADGLDEISVCDVTHVAEWDGQKVRTFTITPESVDIPRADPQDLQGGDAQANADILRALLRGKLAGAPRDAVAVNAAAGLVVANVAHNLRDGVARAYAILQDGSAYQLLTQLAHKSAVGVG